MIQETSLIAYNYKIKPELSPRQELVYNAMRYRDNWTIAEISKFVELPEKCVCGRLDELEKMGKIEVIGGRHIKPVKRACKVTGSSAMQWRITESNGQMKIF